MADSTNPTTSSEGERQPLLAPSFSNTHTVDSASNTYSSTESESTHSGYDGDESVFDDNDSEIDEDVLNGFAAKFGASIGPLGLDGAVTIAPPIRRFSVHQYPYIDSRRRGSLALDPDLLPSGKKRSYSTVSALKRPYAQWIEEIRNVEGAESSSDAEAVGPRRSKYLGGVSTARFWAVFASILLVYFVACFDSTLMASSHPAITSYFNASNSASWLSTSFLLTSTAFQPIFSRLSDTIGRRPPFIFALATFALGTVWCGAAQSIMSFILARAFCGMGAGSAIALGSIINSDMVPLEIRGQYQSMLNLAFGIGSSLGAALGGFLADTLGWRMEFFIQVPSIAICFAVAWLAVPTDLGPQLMTKNNVGIWDTIRAFDLAGSLLLTSAVTFLIVGMNLGGNVLPWTHPVIILALVLSVVGIALFIWVEKRADQPIIPLKVLFSRPRGNLVFGNFLASMTMNTILFNVPLYFQAVLLDSATTSGTRLILPFVFNMSAGFSTGFIITWTGRMKHCLVVGYMCFIVGSILLSVMGTGLPSWAYTVFLVAASLGQGFSYPSTSLAVLATSHQDDLAVATSVLILFRSLGTVMGVSVSSLVVQNSLFHYLDVFVGGSNREEVIRMARKSVSIIAKLPRQSQLEVVAAYASALRLAFVCAAVTSTIAFLLVFRIRLPRLGSKSYVPPTRVQR